MSEVVKLCAMRASVHGRECPLRRRMDAKHASFTPVLQSQGTGTAVSQTRCLYPQAQPSAPQNTYLELRDDWRRPICSPLSGKGHSVCVALGKFDAMHRGHRCLVEEATRLGGYPCLLSFWGMAEVLGLSPRKPLTATVDRSRVLSLWASHCAGQTPMQRNIPFASIRHMSAPEFVDLLWEEFQIKGYKARGDAKLLRQLGEERGMRVSIVDLRDAAYQNASETCSSSRVRESLQMGDVQRVHSHLDRPYAIVVACEALHLDSSNPGAWKFSGADALTQIPAAARYHANVCSGSAKVCAAQVVLNVGETGGWAEMDGARLCMPGVMFDVVRRHLAHRLAIMQRPAGLRGSLYKCMELFMGVDLAPAHVFLGCESNSSLFLHSVRCIECSTKFPASCVWRPGN